MVLREHPAEQSVQKFAEQDLGLKRSVDASSDVSIGITRDIVWEIADDMVLQYNEDSLSETSIIALAGPIKKAVKDLGGLIERYFKPWSLEELVARVDETKNLPEHKRMLLQMGIGAPREHVSGIFRRIKDAMTSDDTEVRRAGVWAASYSRWPECRGLVEKVALHDQDEGLRRDAQIVLRYYSD